MPTNQEMIQPANLPAGAFLLTDNYKPENVTFSLWVVQKNKNYMLVAVTLPRDPEARDLMEALDERFLKFVQDYAEWEYLAGRVPPEVLALAPSQFRACDLQREEAMGVGA